MRQLHFSQILATMLLSLSSIMAMPLAAQSTSLDELPAATQDEISRVCLPVQYREGAGAYRNCVQTEISLRDGTSNNPSDLARLSFDDKYAVQQACAKAGGQSSADYQTCVTTQISELNAVEAPKLELISEDELYVVQQSCFDAQSKQGAANYRRCLNGEVNSLLAIPAADTSNLNMLKKNALQLRCSSNASNAVQYRQCVASEFESIAGRAPSFLPVSTAAVVTATQPTLDNSQQDNQTVNEQTVNKVVQEVAQRQQTQTEPATTTAAPSDNSAQLAGNEAPQEEPTMSLPRNIAPPGTDQGQLTEVVNNTTSDATNADTVNIAEVVNSDSNDTPAVNNESDNTLLLAQNSTVDTATQTSDAAGARVISRPELVETLNKQAQAKAQGIELDAADAAATSAPDTGTDLVSKASDLWQQFLNSLSSLDSTGWLIIAGILALPALLLGLFSFTRHLKPRTAVETSSNPDLASRIEPGLQTRRMRHEEQAASLFEDENPTTADDIDHDAITRIATKSERPLERTGLDNALADEHIDIRESALPDAPATQWQSAFGGWLQRLPDTEKTRACIEFLIYWVAYGDDRYEPELKKRLFTATDLSSHDEIKRWVLKQDVFAFSDVIVWMRQNATQAELDQAIGLIWALLVTENNVTPVQNTLIRYLSDAFGIGKEKIESRFEKAFGHPLPNMPRTDNLAWWAKQDDTQVQDWNARAIATRPEKDQMIARLGLPATHNEAQVINAFRRAARRCHPDRFTALGDRERAMAEQRFIKFEEARDKLLGVSV